MAATQRLSPRQQTALKAMAEPGAELEVWRLVVTTPICTLRGAPSPFLRVAFGTVESLRGRGYLERTRTEGAKDYYRITEAGRAALEKNKGATDG